jgi:tetratricopeptide (TPR) repeat protein
MVKVIDLSCPGCGVKVSTSTKKCEYCGNPIVITTFGSVNSMSPLELNKYAASYRKTLAENPDNKEISGSIAMCYLKLKLYDKAIESFEKAVEDNFDNSETFFYAAVSLLKGQKAFVTPRTNIDKAVEYLNAAIMIEPKGIYYYFLSYIKYDYFNRKFFNTTPTYQETLQLAKENGVSDFDIEQFFSILNIQKPKCM